MTNLRRIVMCFLMAVAALSAVRAMPVFAAEKTIAAPHHCECDEHCNLSKSACGEQGVCATACGGLMAADISVAPPFANTRDNLHGFAIAGHDGITRPPPLGPPRA